MNKIFFYAALFFLMIIVLVSCNSAEDTKVKENKSGSSLVEEPTSSNYEGLKVNSEFRKNLTSQTVVEGIINNSTPSKFSKVKLKVKFLNKKGKVLKSDIIAIVGTVLPGDTPYKNKFSYWDASFSKVSVDVASAEEIN